MAEETVSIFVRTVDPALSDAARAAEKGADLVEFRIDQFTDQPQELAQLVERSSWTWPSYST